ncbi:radical SAM protein [Saccharopolyspora flava]|uniref:4Fe-4S single cluster domain-containing protein n=1 Tax=Saccharopolyspora flava TaxID=95161 RepID=A0A1I6TU91_9PSEU|nr:radical SAM protein [Saccharopolyspora flava]SFS92734.1 4Fe-4S single cluster domain-containing protein [Saccharopolyspora flava]
MGQASFVWLEITGKCQLECAHCYADSGPGGDHGSMSEQDWRRVIDEAAEVGTRMVQFIGGEPTLHPSLPSLVDHARSREVEVEVFSNLVSVHPVLWDVLAQPGVRLATSYYSTDAAEHATITKRRTYARTKANIAEAVRRSIPVRAGVVNLRDGQRSDQAVAELRELGVNEIGTDRLRQVGRGVRTGRTGLDQLCGHCGDDKIAISPTGEVWPCVFSRWMPVGNVRDRALAAILAGPQMAEADATLRTHFATRPRSACDPQCGPNCGPACNPSCWPTGAGPCGPNGGCQPNYDA